MRLQRFFSAEFLIEIVIIAITSLIVLYPVAMLLYGSFLSLPPGQGGEITIQNYLHIFNSKWYLKTLINTLAVASMSTLIAAILGTIPAWIICRTNVPWSHTLDYFALTSIFSSPILIAISWLFLASPRQGYINQLLNASVLNVYSFWGIAWVMALYFTPYMYVFVSSALRSMDPTLEEVSRMSGASNLQTTLNITIPLIRPAFVSGLIMCFVLSIGNFSIPTMIGWPFRYFVLTSRLYIMTAMPPVDYGAATAMAVTIVIISGSLMYLYRRITSRAKYITVTGRGFRPHIIELGKWKYPAFGVCILFFIVTVALPFATVIVSSFSRWGGLFSFTLSNYIEMITWPVFTLSLRNSILVSFIGATLAIGMSLVMSWVTVRTQTPGRGIIDYITAVPIAIPGLVMSFAMLWAWLSLPVTRLIYGTIWILILSGVSHFIPYGVRTSSSILMQVHKELEEAARLSGASWLSTLKDVTVPLIKAGLSSGWIFLFIHFFRSLSMFMLLWTSKTMTLPVLLFESWFEGNYSELATLTVLQSIVLGIIIMGFRKIIGVDVVRSSTIR